MDLRNLQEILFFLIVAVITYLILRLVKLLILKRIKQIAKKTKVKEDDLVINIIDKIHNFFYIILSLYIALQITNVFTERISQVITALTVGGIIFYGTLVVQEIINHLFEENINKKRKEDKSINAKPLLIIKNLIKYTIWVIALLFWLNNIGYNISAIIAGLGIGGIAVAFALQSILGDIFSFVTIFFDKPFKIGDFISFEDKKGTVTNIGIKTTRLTTLEGEELVVPNKKLTDSEIHNFRQMKYRRVIFNLGISYETPINKIHKTKEIIKGAFKKLDLKDTTLERVHLKEMGEYSLIFEIVYSIKDQDYQTYLDTQEKINIYLLENLGKKQIEIAYPTKKIIIEKGP